MIKAEFLNDSLEIPLGLKCLNKKLLLVQEAY